MNTNPTSITTPIEARYHKGILTLLNEVDLPEGANVKVRLTFSDSLSEAEKAKRLRSASGGWEGLIDGEKFIKEVYESRKVSTRKAVEL